MPSHHRTHPFTGERLDPITNRFVGIRRPIAKEINERHGADYASTHSFPIVAAFAALPKGWTEERLRNPGAGELVEVLKANGIKKVAELGPEDKGMLLRLSDLFKKAGAEMYVIGGVNPRQKNMYERKGIKVIDEFAGDHSPKLSTEHNDFDLIFGHRVLSFGGAARPTAGKGAIESAFNNGNSASIDLVNRLAKNRNSRLVLTENWDQLMIDREAISPHARILSWQQYPTMGRYRPGSRTHLDEKVLAKIKDAPNLLVLARKNLH